MQDADGGFYFLVYPKNREYESNVLPENGDSQVVWPKNTSVTAAAVAALAEAGSSPAMKKYYPRPGRPLPAEGQLGWQFLQNAIAKYGKAGAYQKLTFYSDDWTHDDELAWAAAAMYVPRPATRSTRPSSSRGSRIPADSSTFRWGWWRMSEGWGNAIRTYAFAARERPPSAGRPRCRPTSPPARLRSWPPATTPSRGRRTTPTDPVPARHQGRPQGGGWYFSLDQASDMAVAYQINPKPAYVEAPRRRHELRGGHQPGQRDLPHGSGHQAPAKRTSASTPRTPAASSRLRASLSAKSPPDSSTFPATARSCPSCPTRPTADQGTPIPTTTAGATPSTSRRNSSRLTRPAASWPPPSLRP
jgi:hypothetical protein